MYIYIYMHTFILHVINHGCGHRNFFTQGLNFQQTRTFNTVDYGVHDSRTLGRLFALNCWLAMVVLCFLEWTCRVPVVHLLFFTLICGCFRIRRLSANLSRCDSHRDHRISTDCIDSNFWPESGFLYIYLDFNFFVKQWDGETVSLSWFMFNKAIYGDMCML